MKKLTDKQEFTSGENRKHRLKRIQLPSITVNIANISYDIKMFQSDYVSNQNFRYVLFERCEKVTFFRCKFQSCVFLQNIDTDFQNCDFDGKTVILNANIQNQNPITIHEPKYNKVIKFFRDNPKERFYVMRPETKDIPVFIAIRYEKPARVNIFSSIGFNLYTVKL